MACGGPTGQSRRLQTKKDMLRRKYRIVDDVVIFADIFSQRLHRIVSEHFIFAEFFFRKAR